MANLKPVKEAIADISELDVITFSGKIQASLMKDNAFNWDALLPAAIAEDSVIHIVAATKLKVDGDAIFFIAEDADGALVAAHRDAVAAAQNYRQGILELFGGFFGLKKD